MPDTEQRQAFFDALFARCTEDTGACLTLTAIHPEGKHSTPSRHIPVHDPAALCDALTDLDRANALGWGAYFAVGLRRHGLTRWQRGGAADVVVLPALFVDVDDPSLEALARLQHTQPSPSCIVSSGGGYHVYWWLNEPTTDLNTARLLLRGLAEALGGDSLSVAQSLRVVGSVNTKPSRGNVMCSLLQLHERRYALDDFAAYLPRPSPRPTLQRSQITTSYVPSADLLTLVVSALMQRGGRMRGDWVNAACPFPERHRNADQHPSFGFNIRSAYGFCHVCGTLLLKDLCAALNVRPSDHDGMTRKEVMPSSAARVSSRILTR